MNLRRIGKHLVSPIGLGCMGMSHAYGVPNRASTEATLHGALDAGCNFLDTAALYGFGKNESLIGEVLNKRRNEYILASKCGLIGDQNGKRILDARPNVIRNTCESSLKNLRTDHIDLYYLHRVDPNVPLEDQLEALTRLKEEGKISEIGLSEVSAATIIKATKLASIAAVQSEYSLWTRNPENQVLDTCRENAIAFVAFSPLGRGFLAGALTANETFSENDIRRAMPRFNAKNLALNLELCEPLLRLSQTYGYTIAQLSLAWLLSKESQIIPIPGTQNIEHFHENFEAQNIKLSSYELSEIDRLMNDRMVFGKRYSESVLATMET